MTAEEKRIILDQAILLFDHLYPHLAFKKQLFGDLTDPVENLAATSWLTENILACSFSDALSEQVHRLSGPTLEDRESKSRFRSVLLMAA